MRVCYRHHLSSFTDYQVAFTGIKRWYSGLHIQLAVWQLFHPHSYICAYQWWVMGVCSAGGIFHVSSRFQTAVVWNLGWNSKLPVLGGDHEVILGDHCKWLELFCVSIVCYVDRCKHSPRCCRNINTTVFAGITASLEIRISFEAQFLGFHWAQHILGGSPFSVESWFGWTHWW